MTSVEGGGVTPTPTRALHVALPPAPVTVAVYRVEEVGETDLVPAAMGVIAPAPLSIDPEVAFVLVQESVDELPAVMEAGEEVRVQEGVPVGVMTFSRYLSTLHPEILLSQSICQKV